MTLKTIHASQKSRKVDNWSNGTPLSSCLHCLGWYCWHHYCSICKWRHCGSDKAPVMNALHSCHPTCMFLQGRDSVTLVQGVLGSLKLGMPRYTGAVVSLCCEPFVMGIVTISFYTQDRHNGIVLLSQTIHLLVEQKMSTLMIHRCCTFCHRFTLDMCNFCVSLNVCG